MIKQFPAFALGVIIAALYVAGAELGFGMAFVAEQVTTVWPPTGIAIAALLLFGRRYWPAIWLGAFIANASTTAPLWTAFGIATGNTLEAVVAAWGLSRVTGFDPSFRRTGDAVRFLLFAAIASTALGALIGVTTLCISGVQPWSHFAQLSADWMLGDALGALVVAPAIMTIVRPPQRMRRWRVRDMAVMVALTMVVTELVFGRWVVPVAQIHPLEFAIFPFVIAAAVRLGQPATSLVVLAASVVAIANTVGGYGPFATSSTHESLVLLQVFLGVHASSGLVLAATIAERRTAARRRAAAHGVGRVLATADTIEEAAPEILEAICENLEWRFGAMWLLNRQGDRLTCLDTWMLGTGTRPFADASRAMALPNGVGLPGRIWETGEPAWIEDVALQADSPRAAVAREAGLHGAFGVPIRVGNDVLGVIEVFHTRVAPPDADLLVTMTTAGNQIGQFIVRRRAEMAVRLADAERRELLQRERAARQEAEEANRAKDQFLATLSHELRTPLNAIVGWTRMLLDGSVAEGNSRRALEVIERNAQAQVQLVADLLDVSRIITGGLVLDVRPVDLRSVVGAALDVVRPAAEARQIALRATLPPVAVVTLGDAQRLQQIVWNLLSNAVKFTPPGGRVDVEITDAGKSVAVQVRDTGPGIAAEFLPHVFERFRQGDGSPTRQHGGLGLGLAIVRHLVELHGGTVKAESGGPGGGACFSVELPRTVGAELLQPDEDDSAAPRAPLRVDGCRVLVVDDEADARELTATVLTSAGAQVRTAGSVLEALAAVEIEWPDVLLADLAMPDQDGYALIREVRELEITKGRRLPAAAVSAYGREPDRRRALASGFDRHVAKPAEPTTIVETVVALWKPAV